MWFTKATWVFLLLALIQIAICQEDYYKILGVTKNVDAKELKSAYRKLSKKFHPDKNPNDSTAHDKFLEVSNAFDVLGDPDTRQIYDRYGHQGIENHRRSGGGGGQQNDPFDIFARFFGGHGHYGHASSEPRGHNIEVRVELPLRYFYNGGTTEFAWDKQHICEACEGTGSEDRKVERCSSCDGHGVKMMRKQIAPGYFQRIQARCEVCAGRGKTMKHKCKKCAGERVERKAATYEVNVQPGAQNGMRVVYENEADQNPDWVAGDMIVQLVEKAPSPDDNPDGVDGTFFRRQGDDLFWTEVLSLREAWMGDWTRNVTHLDKHVVRLSRPRGQVVQSGHIDTIPGEGMPKWREDYDVLYHTLEYGNLYVTYEVVLPDQMDEKMEADFWAVWQKWRGPNVRGKDEL